MLAARNRLFLFARVCRYRCLLLAPHKGAFSLDTIVRLSCEGRSFNLQGKQDALAFRNRSNKNNSQLQKKVFMSKFTTKVAAVVLTATTVLSLSGVGSIASAQSADLQAQIAALLAQIATLQAQMNGGATATAACTFTNDLQMGSRGAAVTCLQNVLVSKGYLAAGLNTGYYGGMTKAAVMKWQAAAGVSATGYFGAKSRAAFAAMTVTTPVTPGTTPVTPVVNTGTSLWVSKAAGNPTGAAIAGAGQINVGRFAFTAPATAGATITGINFQKVGVLSNSNISNMYLADANTGAVVAQYQSLSTAGVVTFAGLNLMVNAGQTWTGELRADISSSATAGNAIQFDLTGVTAAGTMTVAGLPIAGNSLNVTTVSNPSIAALTLTANAVGSTIDAGTQSVLVSSWTANVSNSAVDLKNLQFTFVGSANPGDIRNLRLLVNGTQVGTLPTASTETTFSISSIQLKTGQSTIQIFADVMGSPNRTFTFSLLQPFKINAVDTQYNAGITASITTTNQTTVTINTGSIVIQTASDSPTNQIPSGASSVTIAKFTVYAAGEPVKIKFIDATFTQRTAPTEDWTTTIATVTDDLSNVRLIDDVGGSLGTSISTIASGTSSGQCTITSTVLLTCHFGTSSSPVNYLVPANTTRVLSLVTDIGSSTDMNTLAGGLAAGTDNMEGQTTFVSTLDSGAANGASRTINTSPLTIAAASGFTTQTYIAGIQQAKIASFVLTASSAQGAQITSLTFDKDSNATIDLQNMVVKVGTAQFGTTKSTIGDAETSLAFSGANPIVVPAGQSITVDVYADILTTSAAGQNTSVIDAIGWSALGSVSGSSISFPDATPCGSETEVTCGQNITLSSGPTLTLAAGSNTAPAKQVVMGSTNNELATFRLSADSVDDIRITDLTVSDTMSSGSSTASFQKMALYQGSTCLAGCDTNGLPMTVASTNSSSVAFALSGSGLVIPKNGSVEVTVKGDVPNFTSGGSVSGSSHVFKILATTDVTARSVGSPTATVTVSAPGVSGNSITVYKTKLTTSASCMPVGSCGIHTRSSVDEVGKLTFTADASYQAVLSTVSLKFSGLAVSNGSTAFTVDLIDTATGVALTGASQQTCTPGAGNSCSVSFSPAYTISAGSSNAKVVIVRINSSSFYDAASTNEALSVTVNAAGSVLWSDGTSTGISLEATQVPVVVINTSY